MQLGIRNEELGVSSCAYAHCTLIRVESEDSLCASRIGFFNINPLLERIMFKKTMHEVH